MIFFILDYSVTPGILTIYNLSNSFEQERKVPGVYVSGSPRIRKRIRRVLAVKKWKVLILRNQRTAGLATKVSALQTSTLSC